MRGVLLISHGMMAEGIYDSLTFFYGEKPENLDYLSLTMDEGPDLFKDALEVKIAQLNEGNGVLIFADMFGGTPANVASHFASEDVQIITGMNLSMILEYMGIRDNDLNIDALIKSGRDSILSINQMLEQKKDK